MYGKGINSNNNSTAIYHTIHNHMPKAKFS